MIIIKKCLHSGDFFVAGFPREGLKKSPNWGVWEPFLNICGQNIICEANKIGRLGIICPNQNHSFLDLHNLCSNRFQYSLNIKAQICFYSPNQL